MAGAAAQRRHGALALLLSPALREAPSPALVRQSCWNQTRTWIACCHPGAADAACWESAEEERERCCHSSPELEPMDADLSFCSLDPALRRHLRVTDHSNMGGRGDCNTTFICTATPRGWVPDPQNPHGEPVCGDKKLPALPRLEEDYGWTACALLEPIDPGLWYNASAYDAARLRYRHGMAVRPHATVPNWRLLQEEPLRLYAFLRHRGVPLSRVLVNIGAGDSSWDDPLAGILTGFPEAARPWRGVYFEANAENCRKAQDNLDEFGSVHLQCGYTTPNSAAETLCRELGRHECAKDARHGRRIDVDAMNLDIDSYDCSVLREALQVVSPKMLVLEVGMAIPPPISSSAEFHPAFLHQAVVRNVTGAEAISGGSTRDGRYFFTGDTPACSFSHAVQILWKHGLGLYRYAMLNAMFVRVDVAEAAGLAGDGAGPWQPADEFECWRRSCSKDHPLGNMFDLTAKGVHSHLMPAIWELVAKREMLRHPVVVQVADPPLTAFPPRPPPLTSVVSESGRARRRAPARADP